MHGLSVIVLTKDSDRLLDRVLESVSWAGEIIVLDSGSTDRTAEIARRYTDGFYSVQWRGFAATRNKGIEMSEGSWILILDSDEVLEPGARDEIENILRCEDALDGYFIRRNAFFLGKRIRFCGWGRDRQLRLFKKGRGQLDERRKVHEGVILEGSTGTLKAMIDHYSYHSIGQYLLRMNAYTSLWADEKRGSGRVAALWQIVVRPPFTFLSMYLFKLGFLDGLTGFILCVLSSHSTFSRYVKLWEMEVGKSVTGENDN